MVLMHHVIKFEAKIKITVEENFKSR